MSYEKQEPMTVGGGNRNVNNLPVDQDGREWSNGLLNCSDDMGTCCMALWCPCIVYGKSKKRLEHLEKQGSPDPLHGGGCCSSDCMIFFCLLNCGFSFIPQLMFRGGTRRRYNIKGSGMADCCSALWCTPCDLTQVSREIELEEQSYQG